MIEHVLINMTLASVLQIWERVFLDYKPSFWRSKTKRASIRHIGDRVQRGSLGPVRFSKMATTTEICPSVETLTNFETAVPCPAQGCTKVFPSTSSLRMHVVKTHNMATCIEEKQVFVRGATKAQVSKHFYCPVEFCPRGKDSKRPFPRLGQLKQVKSIDRLRQTDTDR